METGVLPALNEQVLQMDRLYGAESLAADFITALLETFEGYQNDKAPVELMIQLLHLYDLLLACRPRMANLIVDIQQLILLIHENPEIPFERIIEETRMLREQKTIRIENSVNVALDLFNSKKTILLHSQSMSVFSLLERCTMIDNPPDLFIAAQAPEKTDRIIRTLQTLPLKFSVVSEYSISHVLSEIDFAILGALTLTDAGLLIMGPGSGSLVSLLSHRDIAVYAMLTANKFSFWKETTAPAFKEVRPKELDGYHFDKHVYSHDPVPIHLMTGLITQEGIYKPKEARKLFKTLQQKFFEHESIIRQL